VIVKVIDASRTPVEGAAVTLALICTQRGPVGWNGTLPVQGTTDRDGLFTFDDPAAVGRVNGALVVARKGDQCGSARIGLSRDGASRTFVEVLVGKPAAIAGCITGGGVLDWSTSRVNLYLSLDYGSVVPELSWARFSVHPDPSGSFRCEGLPNGEYQYELADAPGVIRRLGDRSAGIQKTVQVAAAGTAVITIPVEAAAVVRGRVTDGEGGPVDGAEVTAQLQMGYSSTILFRHREPQATRVQTSGIFTRITVRTDVDGRYELAQLVPGAYDLLVARVGLGMDARPGLILRVGEPVILEHRLIAGGMIRGISGDNSWVCLREAAANGCVHALGKRAAFQIAGLAPGRYDVGYWSGDTAFHFVRTVTVEAGKASWVDLRQPDSCVVCGALFSQGTPMCGVEVSAGRVSTITAGDGTFALAVGDIAVGRARAGLTVRHNGVRIKDCSFTGSLAGRLQLGSIEIAAHRLQIRVLDVDGQPVRAILTLYEGYAVPEPMVVDNGVLEDQWVHPGELHVEARLADGTVIRKDLSIPTVGEPAPVVLRASRLVLFSRD
jgi:hypothetical protein